MREAARAAPIVLGNGRDIYEGTNQDDVIYGRKGDDFLDGDAGDDQLWGMLGEDTLVGDVGDDRLFGSAGSDVLFGWDDADRLTGGAGATCSGKAPRDVITDFQPGKGDRIDLSLMDANWQRAGDQNFAWVGADSDPGGGGPASAG